MDSNVTTRTFQLDPQTLPTAILCFVPHVCFAVHAVRFTILFGIGSNSMCRFSASDLFSVMLVAGVMCLPPAQPSQTRASPRETPRARVTASLLRCVGGDPDVSAGAVDSDPVMTDHPCALCEYLYGALRTIMCIANIQGSYTPASLRLSDKGKQGKEENTCEKRACSEGWVGIKQDNSGHSRNQSFALPQTNVSGNPRSSPTSSSNFQWAILGEMPYHPRRGASRGVPSARSRTNHKRSVGRPIDPCERTSSLP